MDEKFNSILSIALIPQTVDLIVKNEGLNDISAMNEFYQSKTYEMLAKEETKMLSNVKLSEERLFTLFESINNL